MAKTKCAKPNQNVKDCCVKLDRLSSNTIKRHLKVNQTIAYNIAAKIKNGTLRIGETSIGSNNKVFNVCLKIRAAGFTIVKSPALPQSRTLRSRLAVNEPTTVNLKPKPNRNPISTVATLQPKPINKLIDDAWRNCKLSRQGELHLNDVVMAKLKGHPAWPATLIELMNKTKGKVLFLGANPNEKFGFVSMGEVVRFEESMDVIRLTLKREFHNKAKFVKGIKEAELIFGIPSHLSLLNE